MNKYKIIFVGRELGDRYAPTRRITEEVHANTVQGAVRELRHFYERISGVRVQLLEKGY